MATLRLLRTWGPSGRIHRPFSGTLADWREGCQIAARTYRDWTRTNHRVAARTISDAVVINQVRDLAWRVGHEACAG